MRDERTYEAGSVQVRGVVYRVAVEGDGTWYAYVADQKVTAETKTALTKAIDRQTRKAVATVAVPFAKLVDDQPGVRHGVATGVHSRTGNVLVRWDSGDTEQIASYDSSARKLVHPLSKDEEAEWITKRRQFMQLARELKAFEDAHKIASLRKAVSDALDAAVAGVESK